jgi:succinate-acetate transporter protein
MIRWGGYLGLGAVACAFYLALAELCEFSHGRSVLPVWSLTKHWTGATLNSSQQM